MLTSLLTVTPVGECESNESWCGNTLQGKDVKALFRDVPEPLGFGDPSEELSKKLLLEAFFPKLASPVPLVGSCPGEAELKTFSSDLL